MISLNDELVETIKQGYCQDLSHFCVVETLQAPSNSAAEVAASPPKSLCSDFKNGWLFVMVAVFYRRQGLLATSVIGDKATRTLVLRWCHGDLVSGHLTTETTLELIVEYSGGLEPS
jgi:hypothetical protein